MIGEIENMRPQRHGDRKGLYDTTAEVVEQSEQS
jgi:hypothetical protein